MINTSNSDLEKYFMMDDTEQPLITNEFLQVVSLIPYGKVATYGQIAKLSGLPKHARHVGFALKKLDNHSDLPWYRVVNSQGKISLQKENERGENLQVLKLQNEGVFIVDGKINLKQYQWNTYE